MTHTFVARKAYRKLHVFSLVMALALLTTGALANSTNSIPYEEDFEDAPAGTIIAGTNDWASTNGWHDADAGTGTVVVADSYTYPLDRPLVNAHSKHVALSGTVSNLFDGTGDGNTNVWIDVMVMPAFSATAPEVDNNIQLALYVDTNGLINIRHDYYVLDGLGFPELNGADWSTLSHAPVTSNRWIRLTVTMDYLTSGVLDSYYQVHLNGGAALAGSLGVSDPAWGDDWEEGDPLSRDGTWFMTANNGSGKKDVDSITMLGQGAFDDLQVKITNVLETGTTHQIVASADVPTNNVGTIYPGGTLNIPAGDDVTFEMITLDPVNYELSDVLVGTGGSTSSIGAVTSHTVSNVLADYTIEAVFVQKGTYEIVASANVATNIGTISPSGTLNIPEGDDVEFVMTTVDTANYALSDVLVGTGGSTSSLGAVTSHTITNVMADYTIEAIFVEVTTYEVVASANVSTNIGTINPSGTLNIPEGDDVEFVMTTVDANYELSNVLLGTGGSTSSLGAVTSHTITNVLADYTIEAIFVEKPPYLGNSTNSIPYEEDFEDAPAGTIIAGSNAWARTNGWHDATAGTDTVVVADTYTYPLDLPLDNAHSKHVVLSGTVSNLFDETGDGNTNVWIDMMVMPVSSATAPEVSDNAQLALYVDTNGLINIRHDYYVLDGLGFPELNGADWSALSHTPISSNEWIRLTVTMDYLTSGSSDAYYQVQLNGGDALAGLYGVSDPTWGDDWEEGDPLSRDGTWFMTANNGTGEKDLDAIHLNGQGAFDDVQVKLTNVLDTGSGPVYTPKGVPEDWYTGHGLDPADEEVDSDNDGALNWEEYVAGTVPTNDASVFILLGVEYAGDSNKVSWYATTDGGAATNPFSMLISTNLQSWVTNELNSIPHDADGTYDWWDTNPPAAGPVHYRPVILWE